MRRIFGLTLLLSLPLSVNAACLNEGYTVVFINGIFNTREQAEQSKLGLKQHLGTQYRGQPLEVELGYNPSHIAGLGDLAQAAVQGFAGSISTFDRDTILLQIHPEVTTRKVFFVGHSQGTFYANDIYEYLLTHGEPKAAVGVYNVATPANYVAGGGKYLTSKADTIINNLYAEYARTAGALPPLSPNLDVDFGGATGNGHNFVNNYLKYGGERMVEDIQAGLARLKADEGTAAEGCFTPPEEGLGYKTKQVFYAIADPAAVGIKVAAVTGAKGATTAFSGVVNGLAAAGSFFGSLANAVTPKPRTENLPGSFDVVRAIYGAGATEEDLNDLLGKSQSGAVALAVPQPKPKPAQPEPKVQKPGPKAQGEVKGIETEQLQEPLIPPPVAIGGGGSPGFGGGGDFAPAPETETLVVPSTSAVVLFDATTTPPVLAISECAASPCSVSATGLTLNWSAVPAAVGYDVVVNGGALGATTTGLTTLYTLTPGATSTISVAAYDASGISLVSNSIEVATSSPAPAPTYTVLYEQRDASTLGQAAQEVPNYLPGQRLGKGLAGTIGSIVYKVQGTDVATQLSQGWGAVQLMDCMDDGGSYIPVSQCQSVSSSLATNPQILAQSGDDATVLVTMPAYTFENNHYYFLHFLIVDGTRLYGSSSETAYRDATSLGAWVVGPDFASYLTDANGVADWAFRICEGPTCSF